MIGPSQLGALASIKGYNCVKFNLPEEVTHTFLSSDVSMEGHHQDLFSVHPPPFVLFLGRRY